ncbi:enolase C-terminal domain-like protein, partial [Salmonella enterica]|uniref:enolase C-terminal domain-like protein n=1 Tax=Salmonella enterica TaxID=28901 RepID=UPI0032971BCE
DDAGIIVERHSLLATNAAIQFPKAIEKYRMFLYEERIHPLNSDNMQKVSRSRTIPIATGQRSYTRWAYRALLE